MDIKMNNAKERSKDVLIEDKSINFESLFLSNQVLKGLKDNDFIKPSPIQLKAIPLGKCGFDLIVKAKSGTGKTAVFAIIALELIETTNFDLQVLILSPTREIAVQTCDVIRTIGKHIPNLKVEHFIGGLPVKEDEHKIKGCHIAVASPGRMLHLINSNSCQTQNIKLFVLDEADSLMNTSFQSDINQIYHSLPKSKQMLAISATYPNELDIFLSQYMNLPTHVSPQMDTPLLLGLKHFVTITSFNANALFLAKIKNKELLRLLSKISFTQCLIFSNYQTRVEDVHTFLNANGWKSSFIFGAQTQKQRLEALNELKQFRCRILLSTDLTARGIDAVNVDLVINYDIPNDESTYLHRMGRAGRYGSKGICLSIASKGQEVEKFCDIIGNIGGIEMSVPILPATEFPENIWEANTESFDCLKGNVMMNQEKVLSAVREIYENNKSNKDSRNKRTSKNVKNNDCSIKDDNDSNKSIENEIIRDDAVSDDDDTMDILQQLANGHFDRDKESTRTQTNDSKISIYQKNVSLLSVTSLLDDDRIEIDDNETTDTIQSYINTLKLSQETNHPPPEPESHQSYEMDNSEAMPNIENIFSHAYDYAISKSNRNWEDIYCVAAVDNVDTADDSIKEDEDASVNLFKDLLEYAANDEPEYDNYGDEDEENEHNQEMNEDPEDVPTLQWVPVQVHHCQGNEVSTTRNATEMPVSKNNDNNQSYNELYTSAMNELHNTFNTLESADAFDNVWRQWHNNINSIQEYVQQNLYLEEMNAYKCSLDQ